MYKALLEWLQSQKEQGCRTIRVGKLNTWGDKFDIDYLIYCVQNNEPLNTAHIIHRGVSAGTVNQNIMYGAHESFTLDMIPALCWTNYKISEKEGAWINPNYNPNTPKQHHFNEEKGDCLSLYDRRWGELNKKYRKY